LDFEEYILQIGVNAFYAGGELRYEVPTGLGRMDILLTWRGRKYVVETKVNRGNRERTIDRAVLQLCEKYLLTEQADEGYVVVFDIKTRVGCSSPKDV